MRELIVLMIAAASAACAEEQCVDPLSAGAGSDTAVALAAATDTLRHMAAEAGDGGWAVTSFVRRAADSMEVGAIPRCWQATDPPTATVLVGPSGQVVWVSVMIGG